MEAHEIESLKKDVIEQEQLTKKFLKKAEQMNYLMILSAILFFVSLIFFNVIICGLSFIATFFFYRNYNIAMGEAELHNGLHKFLRTLLIQEQTGVDLISNIIQ